VITLLINHFKAQDGTAASTKRRALQAKYVRKYAELAAQDGKLPIVIGDLNIDTKQKGYDNSLDPLLKSTAIKDPFKAGPDLWTHFYSHDKSVSRLDYILVSPKLKVTATDIFRKGLSTKCKQYAGTRFSTIGPEHTEASDHCPTSIVIEV
jgi:endonuclease/exonuclease/phosphatase family metal-dependent hydrolase